MKKNILVVGLGLLGTSLLMALKGKGYNLFGYARREEVTKWAINEGIITEESCDTVENLIAKADIVVLALPIPATVSFLERYQNDFKTDQVVTDIGSTKKAFMDKCDEVLKSKNIKYVGSHPMAGTEKSGPFNAFKDLYNNADVFICSDNFESNLEKVEDIESMWQSISCKTVRITTSKHDKLVAKTSHVAHILASALTISVLGYGDQDDNFHGCASGFRDTSRTASSDPQMWREITELNRDAILEALDTFELEYKKFRVAVENKNFDDFEKEFDKGRQLRSSWLNYMKNK